MIEMSEMNNSDLPGSYPITLHHISYHAVRMPDNIAVVDQGKALSYAIFYRDICKMIIALSAFKFEPGESVAIEFLPVQRHLASYYLHWVTLLAMEVYGVATISYIEVEAWCLNEIPETLDWVVTFSGKARLNAKKYM